MSKLKHVLSQGLEQTAALWSPIAVAYDWVHQAVLILDNQADLEAAAIQHRFSQLLTTISQGKSQVGKLADGVDHFLQVTSSYWSGLFHCYQIEDLPRTNNDLEHLFGQLRHHQRRVTGRKAAPASLVLRGSVRLIAAVTTRIRTFTVKDFATVSRERWQDVRSQLQKHQLKRERQRRFRRAPNAYLANLEAQFLQLALPH